ncbi:MAG: PGF-pre-PGF domain-containing protein, partial [Methanoregula sp.]|nr:PGF-pre-PGF domain-containing protein [Methanoregula sp.]
MSCRSLSACIILPVFLFLLVLCTVPVSGMTVHLPDRDAVPALFAGNSVDSTSPVFQHDRMSGTWSAFQPAHGIGIVVMGDGKVNVIAPTGSFGMQYNGIGRNGALSPARAGTIRADRDRLTIDRGTATEWYICGNQGIEQGMTIASHPEGAGLLNISFALYGDLIPAVLAGQTLFFSDPYSPVMVYGSLIATDAAGRVLPASMTLDGNTLVWQIDDRNAIYPVTIDPVVVPASSATARFIGGAASDEFGSVSLSPDGSRALVGAPYNDTAGSNTGAAYIFDKPPGGWSGTKSASEATARFTGGAVEDYLGISVSLSSDGSRALIGAYGNDTAGSFAGAAYIFDKPPGGWSGTTSASAATARFTGGAKGDSFGNFVSLSSDGTRALIGAYCNDTAGPNAGDAYIFDKPSGGWSGTTSASAATARFIGGAAADYFGVSVSLSSDGSRALIGAYDNATVGPNAGAAYIFDKPSGGWSGTTSASAATARFIGSAADEQLGNSVSLSSDGSRALIGAFDNDTAGSAAGAAYIFDKPPGGWSGTTSASAATARFTGGAKSDQFGYFVSLSSDGSRALVGASANDTAFLNAGAAYTFDKPPGGWSGTTSASEATEWFTGGAAGEFFGRFVSLSSDGSLAFVGAKDNSTAGSSAGAAYIFTINSPPQAPTVTGINPVTGPNTSTTSVTITGTGFNTTTAAGTAVSLNRTGYTNITISGITPVSSTSLSTTIPVNVIAGAWNVTVINPDGQTGTNELVTFTVTVATPTPTPSPTPTPTQAPSGSDDGGDPPGQSTSSTGGVSIANGAPADQTVMYSFGEPALDYPVWIESISFVPDQSIGQSQCLITHMSPSAGFTIPDRPAVYESIQINWINPSVMSEATIQFSVKGYWLREQNIGPQDIVMMRQHDLVWDEIPTVFDHVANDIYYFRSTTPGFSNFAVSV